MTTNKTNVQRLNIRSLYTKPGSFIITLAIIMVGALIAAYFLFPKGERVNSSGYQVVYMTSGQAYFGKLKNTTGEYMVLNTPYTAQDVQPEGKDNAPASTTLLKVSQQQYGPEDVMSLKSSQVLFWQNLRDDSKVAQAIKNQQ